MINKQALCAGWHSIMSKAGISDSDSASLIKSAAGSDFANTLLAAAAASRIAGPQAEMPAAMSSGMGDMGLAQILASRDPEAIRLARARQHAEAAVNSMYPFEAFAPGALIGGGLGALGGAGIGALAGMTPSGESGLAGMALGGLIGGLGGAGTGGVISQEIARGRRHADAYRRALADTGVARYSDTSTLGIR